MHVLIVGGANIDSIARPFRTLSFGESAPGAIQHTVGGVALNVARALARMKQYLFSTRAQNDIKSLFPRAHVARCADMTIHFCTIIGQDSDGAAIKRELTKYSIDSAMVVESAAYKSGRYAVIADEHGATQYGVSDMEIFNHFNLRDLAPYDSIMHSADIVFIDTNLPSQQLQQYVTRFKPQKLFCDPVSPQKAQKIMRILPNIYALKPNAHEIYALSGLRHITPAIHTLRALGIQKIFCSAERAGTYYNSANTVRLFPNPLSHVQSDVGLGDMLSAGLMLGELLGLPSQKQLQFAYHCLQKTI